MSELRTLWSLVDGLPERGGRPVVLALHKEGIERWSYAGLADHARWLAHGLTENGIRPGDHVALFAVNRPGWVVACLGVIEAGAVIVPLDAQLGDEMLRHALNDSGVKLLFTTSEEVDRIGDLGIEAVPEPVLFDVEEEDERDWRRLFSDRDAELPLASLVPDDRAALFYTSGTTGTAKGVPLSHGNLAFQIDTLLAADLVTEDDRILLPLPLHHVYPFVIGMLTPLAAGLPIIIPQSLAGPQIVRALREGEASLIVGVPQLYDALYSSIAQRSKSGSRIFAALFDAAVSISTWLRRWVGLRIGKLLMRPLHKQFGPKLRVLASGGAALDPDLAWKLEGLGWQ